MIFRNEFGMQFTEVYRMILETCTVHLLQIRFHFFLSCSAYHWLSAPIHGKILFDIDRKECTNHRVREFQGNHIKEQCINASETEDTIFQDEFPKDMFDTGVLELEVHYRFR